MAINDGISKRNTIGSHRHFCITPACGKRYNCQKACDRGHLKDSICDECLKREAFA